MKNLVQRLINGVVAVGLAACVSCGSDQTEYKPNLKPATVEVPVSVDYKTIKWEEAYFKAITSAKPNEIFLFSLRFQSYLKGKDGINVVRYLTDKEIDELKIETRQDLADFLKGKKIGGYMGPRILQ